MTTTIHTFIDDDYDPSGESRRELHIELAYVPEQLLSILGWCEAWNTVLNKDNRGGKRKGAGRNKKETK